MVICLSADYRTFNDQKFYEHSKKKVAISILQLRLEAQFQFSRRANDSTYFGIMYK